MQKKQLLRSRAAVSCLLLFSPFSPFSPSSFPLLLPFPFPFYLFPDHLLLLFASSCPPLPPPKALTTALKISAELQPAFPIPESVIEDPKPSTLYQSFPLGTKHRIPFERISSPLVFESTSSHCVRFCSSYSLR